MTYPAGSLISKSNMVSEFNSVVITARNALVTWQRSNTPFYPNNTNGSLVSASTDITGSNPSSIDTGGLSNPISASNIVSTFYTAALAASNIATITLIKYYNNGGSYSVFYNQTAVASTSSALSSISYSSAPGSSTIITASVLESFVTSLYNALKNQSASTISAYEYYCHTSCHVSCHSSRSRR